MRIPSADNTPGDFALGQPDLVTGSQNTGGRGPSTLKRAYDDDGTRLFVADAENFRVLIWNTIPNVSGAAADVVLGQPDFSSAALNNGGIGPATMSYSNGVYSTGSKLVVTEDNKRILIWNSIPTVNFTPADIVLGQPDFTSNTANNGGVSASSITSAIGIASDGVRLIVPDPGNNRILIWMTWPTESFQPADVVIGQTDMNSNSEGLGDTGLKKPTRVSLVGNEIWVTDAGNVRILKFTIPPN